MYQINETNSSIYLVEHRAWWWGSAKSSVLRPAFEQDTAATSPPQHAANTSGHSDQAHSMGGSESHK